MLTEYLDTAATPGRSKWYSDKKTLLPNMPPPLHKGLLQEESIPPLPNNCVPTSNEWESEVHAY
jgi:hypothetical protein